MCLDIAARRSACAAGQGVRVGVVINGRARVMAGAAAQRRLRRSVAGHGPVEVTPSLAALPGAVHRLLCDQGVNVLAIAGGDGTVHHVVQALLALHEQHVRYAARCARAAAHGDTVAALVDIPLPRLLLLRGGTLNIVARTLGSREAPHRQLADVVASYGDRTVGDVPVRMVPTLAVSRADEVRHGFVFGSETLYHAIELYVRFGAGYQGLGRFLLELGRGALVGSELWRREGWKLGPFGAPLETDRGVFPAYTAVVAATVDLTLAISAIRAIRRAPGAAGFHAKVVLEQEPSALVAMVPKLMTDRPARGVADLPEVRELRLRGPYTLDGECFDDPDPARSSIVVREGARLLPMVLCQP